jgi:hypothetical protein
MSAVDSLKTAAAAGILVVSRVVGCVALGLLINLVVLLLLGPELRSLFRAGLDGTGAGGAHSGAVALLLLVPLLWRPLGLLALFALAFPCGYFLVGKKLGVTLALQRLLRHRKEALLSLLAEQLAATVERRPAWQEQVQRLGLPRALAEQGPTALRRLDTLPLPLRWLARLLVEQVHLEELFAVLRTEDGVSTLDLARLSRLVVSRVGTRIDEALFSPSLAPLGGLVLANLVSFILVKLTV